MSTALSTVPNSLGRFGPYGGRYVPETLVPALEQLELAYAQARTDPSRPATDTTHIPHVPDAGRSG